MISDWYTDRWWVDCYIWYSKEGPGQAVTQPNPLIAVPNVTAHPSTVSVSSSYYLMWHHNCLCTAPVLQLVYWVAQNIVGHFANISKTPRLICMVSFKTLWVWVVPNTSVTLLSSVLLNIAIKYTYRLYMSAMVDWWCTEQPSFFLSFSYGVAHTPFACQRWGLPQRLAQCATPGMGLV